MKRVCDMSKRSQSTVISTVLIILLVIALVAILAVVITTFVRKSTSEIGLEKFTTKLSIDPQYTKFAADGSYLNVKVDRGAGEGEIDGINIILTDDKGNVVPIYQKGSIAPVGSKTYTISSGQMTGLGTIKTIAIAPKIIDDKGKAVQIDKVAEITMTGGDLAWISGSDLLAYYPFDSNADDASENGNDLTPSGSPAYVAGKVGKAVKLNGAGDYLRNSSDGSKFNMGTDSFSIAFWMNASSKQYTSVSGNSVGFIVSKRKNGEGSGYQVGYTSTVSANPTNAGVPMSVQAFGVNSKSNSVSASNWHHIVSVYNKDRLDVSIYVDGTLDVTFTRTTAFNGDSVDSFYVGKYDGSPHYFNGTIDEMRIYKTALTAEQVQMLYELN